MRTITAIEADLKAATASRASFRRLHNEGQGGYVDESKIEALTAELTAARKAEEAGKLSGESLRAEREWFNSQGFTSPAAANAACLKRGYSMEALFAAIKSAKAAGTL